MHEAQTRRRDRGWGGTFEWFVASNQPHSHDWFLPVGRYMAVNCSWSDIRLLQRCKMSSDVCLVERSRRKSKRHYFIKTMLRVPPPRVKQNLKNALLGFLPDQETLLPSVQRSAGWQLIGIRGGWSLSQLPTLWEAWSTWTGHQSATTTHTWGSFIFSS